MPDRNLIEIGVTVAQMAVGMHLFASGVLRREHLLMKPLLAGIALLLLLMAAFPISSASPRLVHPSGYDELAEAILIALF